MRSYGVCEEPLAHSYVFRGKVLVSTREHIDRLIASRLMADVMGAETILVARTDAEAATLLDSNIDPKDHAFILGSTNPSLESVQRLVDEASREQLCRL